MFRPKMVLLNNVYDDLINIWNSNQVELFILFYFFFYIVLVVKNIFFAENSIFESSLEFNEKTRNIV